MATQALNGTAGAERRIDQSSFAVRGLLPGWQTHHERVRAAQPQRQCFGADVSSDHLALLRLHHRDRPLERRVVQRQLLHIRGNVIAAINHYNAGLTTLEEDKNSNTAAKFLSNLGYLYAKGGRCDEARAAYSHAVRVSRESGDRVCEASSLESNRAGRRLSGHRQCLCGD